MTSGSALAARFESCLSALERRNQQHALRWWGELDSEGQSRLLDQVESIPWETVEPLIASHVLDRPRVAVPSHPAPAPVYPRTPRPEQKELYEEARLLGERLLAAGKVAAFTVAGGQGTRLGYDGPKGAVAVTPVGDKSLFSIFAETILAVRDRTGATIPWYVMTSPGNRTQTEDYLRQHAFFGLPAADVSLVDQAMLPAFDHEGRLILEAKDRIAMAPDGHGGSLKALATGGALADMRARGVEIISYFQVDNPLVKPLDPLFIGLHAKAGSEMSAKVAPKADDHEKVGNVCSVDGKVLVIEYTDFPEELARAKDADGHRRFDAGNLAIHLLNVAFVERIVGRSLSLPFRRADKVVTFINDAGDPVTPAAPNAIKFETFVFDALPLAKSALVLEVDRAEEFSPVKNATGVDSLESSQRDQNLRACRWLAAAGATIPRRADGEPDVTIAIAPSFAVDAAGVRARCGDLPNLQPGATVYIE